MSVFKRGNTWWYKFYFARKLIRESSKSTSKTVAKDSERKRRRELERGFNGLADDRSSRVQTITEAAENYLTDYRLRHRSVTFAEYAVGNVVRHLGERMLVELSDKTVMEYQSARLKEGVAPKTINEEVGFLLRLLGEPGEGIRGRLRRQKVLRLPTAPSIGRAFSQQEKTALLNAARATRSPLVYPALMLALNTGMRDAEIRFLKWQQVDLDRHFLTVGKSKTAAGEGRTIPINNDLFLALTEHARWYTDRFGTICPGWYLFPFGKANQLDPTRPVTTLKTAWTNVRKTAGVKGRWHDARHTLITELAENGAGDQVIMDIAGHVSRQMLARYSHIRMEAKRRALEAVGATFTPADQPTAETKLEDGTPTGTVQ